jgi:hypothetical protein
MFLSLETFSRVRLDQMLCSLWHLSADDNDLSLQKKARAILAPFFLPTLVPCYILFISSHGPNNVRKKDEIIGSNDHMGYQMHS